MAMGAAKPPHRMVNLSYHLLLLGELFLLIIFNKVEVEALWCVARSEASDKSLQTALDYACAAGADCAPLQSSGLCFLPNTLQAHASYAFNSYYQRKRNDPGSCAFAGTATIAKTDPSYGSCVYPSSPNTAGGGGTTLSAGGGGGGGGGGMNNSTVIPILGSPSPPGNVPLYGNGGSTDQTSSQASQQLCNIAKLILLFASSMLVLCFLFQI